jgi:hypothetical protein
MPPAPVVLTPPMISNLVLTLTKDIANAEVDVTYRINFSTFDQLTNLAYTESWSLVALDGGVKTTIFTGPILAAGVSSNGNAFLDRTKSTTIPWADLDEDLNDDDEIAAVVTLTPRLPTARTAQSATVVVNSP